MTSARKTRIFGTLGELVCDEARHSVVLRDFLTEAVRERTFAELDESIAVSSGHSGGDYGVLDGMCCCCCGLRSGSGVGNSLRSLIMRLLFFGDICRIPEGGVHR